MRFAYADPPYLGQADRYPEHSEASDWDAVESHRELMVRLDADYDGWALSLSSPSLREILPHAPAGIRVAAWVKPFAAFKANVRIAYAWEPVIFKPGRDKSKDGAPVGRDYFSHVITLKKGTVGAKPPAFCRWVLDLVGFVPGDELDDFFPGSGIFGHVLAQRSFDLTPAPGAPRQVGKP